VSEHDASCSAYKGRPDLCDCGVLARERAAKYLTVERGLLRSVLAWADAMPGSHTDEAVCKLRELVEK
jgi:hypothetical protein